MRYSVNYKIYENVFSVPKSLAEKDMKISSGDQIKVLLCVLSSSNEITAESVAKKTGISVYECECALQFWTERGYLLSEDKISLSETTSAENAEKKFSNVRSLEKPQYFEVLKRAEESDEIKDLLQSAQVAFGRTVSSTEQTSLLYYHDTYGLPPEVILMLLRYAVSIGKTNFRYIDKIALDWAEKEINTFEKAEKYLEKAELERSREGKVRRVFGLGDRKLSANEKKLINRWCVDFGYDMDILAVGYNKTVDSIGKFDMKYLDRILTAWHTEGIKTAEAAEIAAEASPEENKAARKRKKVGETSYDVSEIEKSIFKNV